MNKLTITLLILSTLSACAHGNTQKDAALNAGPANASVSPESASTDAVSIEAKLAAAEQGTSDVTEVKFEKGSRTLPALYLKKIDSAVEVAEKKAPLDRVSLAVWSDTEMPKHHQPALPDSDVRLANDRGETLKAYLQQKHAKLSVDIVNMAEKPGKLKRFLKTEDVRIQQQIEIAGQGDPKASRAVIIIETKQKK
jgi:hypothetical protein